MFGIEIHDQMFETFVPLLSSTIQHIHQSGRRGPRQSALLPAIELRQSTQAQLSKDAFVDHPKVHEIKDEVKDEVKDKLNEDAHEVKHEEAEVEDEEDELDDGTASMPTYEIESEWIEQSLWLMEIIGLGVVAQPRAESTRQVVFFVFLDSNVFENNLDFLAFREKLSLRLPKSHASSVLRDWLSRL